MSFELASNAYGKGRVRLTKIIRGKDRHEVKQLTVNVRLRGDFAEPYLTESNAKVLPTDTMKNTVYAIASGDPLESIEQFGINLAAHFLAVPTVERAEIEIDEHRWMRLVRDGKPAPHTFLGSDSELATTRITRDKVRKDATIVSGLKNLIVMNTANSAFKNFYRDQYTTLKDTDDRIMATNVVADWSYSGVKNAFNACRDSIRGAMIDAFADTFSPSVQFTLNEMGKRALAACDAIDEITLTMPNLHNIPFDLAPLGLENRNEIFVATSEPFGLIEGTIRRTP